MGQLDQGTYATEPRVKMSHGKRSPNGEENLRNLRVERDSW